MDIETRPALPAVTRVVVDQPAVPAKVILELSQAEVLLIAAALAYVPTVNLRAAGFSGRCCSQLAAAANLPGEAWYRVLAPVSGQLETGPEWHAKMVPLLNK